MSKRDIIKIDEALCDGCGLCVKGCHEGALQLIDGKARIISELYCDGLGACIGDCPQGAISIETRPAKAYNEIAVMQKICTKGQDTILAHLIHLKDHNELGYLQQGLDYLAEHNIKLDLSLLDTKPEVKKAMNFTSACKGSVSQSFSIAPLSSSATKGQSRLTHFPVQLHLVNPSAEHFMGSKLLLAADCTAFAYGDFHNSLLEGHTLAIACPKLDSNKEVYVNKLVMMIDSSKIKSLTVAIMSVPCCGGLVQVIKSALEKSTRKIEVKKIVISTKGSIVQEEMLEV